MNSNFFSWFTANHGFVLSLDILCGRLSGFHLHRALVLHDGNVNDAEPSNDSSSHEEVQRLESSARRVPREEANKQADLEPIERYEASDDLEEIISLETEKSFLSIVSTRWAETNGIAPAFTRLHLVNDKIASTSGPVEMVRLLLKHQIKIPLQ